MDGESQKLIELAERCEAAAGANHQLEIDICKVVEPDRPAGLRTPNYTYSADAAMTLVPEGQGCTIVQNIGGFPHRATVWTTKGAVADIQGQPGATPALALCAAALRARAAVA